MQTVPKALEQRVGDKNRSAARYTQIKWSDIYLNLMGKAAGRLLLKLAFPLKIQKYQ